jgi:four helix bundle protein
VSERPHRRLIVWQKGVQFVKHVYLMTAEFPKEEQFALTSQMRRAAVSVPSNIAEGAARFTDKDKIHFFLMARASLSELDTQFEISELLGYLKSEEKERSQDLMDELSAMLNGLIKSRRD